MAQLVYAAGRLLRFSVARRLLPLPARSGRTLRSGLAPLKPGLLSAIEAPPGRGRVDYAFPSFRLKLPSSSFPQQSDLRPFCGNVPGGSTPSPVELVTSRVEIAQILGPRHRDVCPLDEVRLPHSFPLPPPAIRSSQHHLLRDRLLGFQTALLRLTKKKYLPLPPSHFFCNAGALAPPLAPP